MKYIFNYISFLTIILIYSCSGAGTKVPVSLTWSNDGYNSEANCYENQFVIKNISGEQLGNDWTIYFSQLPRKISHIQTNKIRIEVINANYYRIYPTPEFEGLEPEDSIVIKYGVNSDVPSISQQPEGCYWVSTANGIESTPMAINLAIVPLADNQQMKLSTPTKIYDNNQYLSLQDILLKQTDILPAVKQVVEKEGKIIILQQVSLLYSNELANEAEILKERLKCLYKIDVSEVAPVTIRLNLLNNTISENKEWYKLDISTDQIILEGATSHGVFNGVQTLLSLMKGRERPNELRCVTITDYPDLPHRGFMIDISRNFTTVSNLKTLIDILASYKLNVLHLHFSDDEGWRLEIPGLEELTEVGSKRGHTTDESGNLYPSYDGGYDPNTKTSGNGHYTREEFIDLIKYASERHVRVIPEIESPGHARAAIVAMKARYKKYIGKDEQKAREYLLSEDQDTSVYTSTQSYTDNVMNVCLPSTYRFMEKVITEIKKMYSEAGVGPPSVHIGGDEVPAGAWEKSPACQAFMKEKEMASTHELFEYFYKQVTSYMQQQGLQFNGWQEVALHNTADTDKQLLPNANGICCWNTVPEWGDDEIPYHIANKGYPVILCNVNNFYMDLAYNRNYDERGHSWAGYVDESKSFAMLPFSIYRSSRTDIAGNPTDLDALEKGKELLKPDSFSNIRGVQAQLFTETIRNFDWVGYYVFPKIFGLVERGWNARPSWERLRGTEERDAFYKDLSYFYALISDKEMPYMKIQDMNFRLANPGLMTDGEYLYANTSLRGASIHYTTDGTEPDQASPVWTKPIKYNSSTIKACIFYLGKKSLTTTLITKP